MGVCTHLLTAVRALRSGPPSEATPNVKAVFVNELQDGAEIDQVLLVREAERRQRRDGGDYLRLRLGDRTGAVVVDGLGGASGEIEGLARAGEAVRVRGRYTVHPRFGPQINLRGLEAPAPGSYSPEDLRDGPAHTARAAGGAAARAARDRPPTRTCARCWSG